MFFCESHLIINANKKIRIERYNTDLVTKYKNVGHPNRLNEDEGNKLEL